MKQVRNMPTLPPETDAPSASDYPPGLFAAVHNGIPGDIDFYRGACVGTKNILELGVGQGRIASALVDLGQRVVGIDNNPALVAEILDPRIETHVADARTFRTNEKFDRVIIPFNGLYCMLNERDLRATLETAYAHLNEDGYFIFDVYCADHFHADADDIGDDEAESDYEIVKSDVDWDGRSYNVFEKSRWKPSEQRIDATYWHVPIDQGRSITSTICHRYLLSQELLPLLEDIGFEVVVIHGGFDQHVFDEESELMVVTSRLKKR